MTEETLRVVLEHITVQTDLALADPPGSTIRNLRILHIANLGVQATACMAYLAGTGVEAMRGVVNRHPPQR